jgi:phospholipase C
MRFSAVIISAAAVSSLMQSGLADSLNSIEHIVIFMQENRAYDHYYGNLNGVRGFNDRAQTILPSGLPSLFQPSDQKNPAQDYILPFPAWTLNTSSICMSAPTMEYFTDLAMVNGGRFDSWNTARAPGMGMSYMTRTDLPYYYALYDAFTAGDQYHQSTYTCTNPNR